MRNVFVATVVGMLIGFAGVWLGAALKADSGMSPFFSGLTAFTSSILVGVLIMAGLRAGSSWRWMTFIACHTGWVVWYMILGEADWLPQVVKDLRPLQPHLSNISEQKYASGGQWAEAVVSHFFVGFMFLTILLYISPSWRYSGGSSSRSAPGSSLGTPFPQSTPSTSYDSPPAPTAPTWTYQAPPATPRLTDHQIKQDSDYRAAQAQNDWNRRQGS